LSILPVKEIVREFIHGNIKGEETMRKVTQMLNLVVVVMVWGVLSILSIK